MRVLLCIFPFQTTSWVTTKCTTKRIECMCTWKRKSIWRIRDSILSAFAIHLKRVKKKLSFSLGFSHRIWTSINWEVRNHLYFHECVYIIHVWCCYVVYWMRGPSRDCLIHFNFYFSVCIKYLDLLNYKLPVILILTGLKLASKKQLDPLTKLYIPYTHIPKFLLNVFPLIVVSR